MCDHGMVCACECMYATWECARACVVDVTQRSQIWHGHIRISKSAVRGIMDAYVQQMPMKCTYTRLCVFLCISRLCACARACKCTHVCLRWKAPACLRQCNHQLHIEVILPHHLHCSLSAPMAFHMNKAHLMTCARCKSSCRTATSTMPWDMMTCQTF